MFPSAVTTFKPVFDFVCPPMTSSNLAEENDIKKRFFEYNDARFHTFMAFNGKLTTK